MACNSGNCNSSGNSNCVDQYGCGSACPDFVIRRNDTKPDFKAKIEDCDGPLDLTDLVLEASMWAKAKLKKSITTTDEYFALADNIGFNQMMAGDVIIMDQIRNPEQMLIKAFDETNKLVQVERGYHGTPIQNWKKGTSFRILKFMNAVAKTEMIYQDVLELDGTTTENVLTDSFFIYEWGNADTCLPGCYYMEFKLIKMVEEVSILSEEEVIPSFTSPSFICGLGDGVEWIRRFPVDSEGFLIKIIDSPTSESNA